ncbi:MAG: hypothetical protein M3454_08795 [Actinomycetota bacterium]|nr:hypothetical protein [Actinomycetota bacterium]
MIDSLIGYWRVAEPYQRFLYRLSTLFLVSAALHAAVFLLDDRPWDGPLSWRKPLLFSLSFTLVCASLAWVMTFLPPKRTAGWLLLGSLGFASFGETALISLQAWRGVPSHFNFATGFDGAIFATMGLLIAVVVTDIVLITLWSLKSLDAPTSFALAIKAGLLLMVVGQGLGGLLIREGLRQEEVGPVTSPLIFGQDGILNLSHAAALHALQLLPVLAWLLSFSTRSENQRTKIVGVAAAGYAGLVLLSGLQALGGRAPFDLSGVGSAVLIVSATAILAASVVALAGLRPRLSMSR